MIQKIPYLKLQFSQQLAVYETPLLRSAVLKLTQNRSVLYHNHLRDGVRFGYPLIQYKSINKQAAILYLSEGIDEVSELYNQRTHRIQVFNRTLSFHIDKIYSYNYSAVTRTDSFYYKIRNWMPLQNDNYLHYQQLRNNPLARQQLLKHILAGNIKSFMQGVSWQTDEYPEICQMEIVNEKWISFKGIKFKAFDARFSTNVFLPPHIGLGKGAAHNYGVIYPIGSLNKNYRNEQPE